MEISDIFKRDNMAKAVAILFVLIFVLSSFTAGILGNANGRTGTNATSEVTGAEMVVNATVSSYQPYIITDTHDPAVAAEIAELPGVDGTMSTSQGYVISLSSTDNITGIYAYISSLNVSGKANAILTLPGVFNITDENGSQQVAGGQIGARIEPIFAEGETMSIKAYLHAENGQIDGYGSVSVLPSLAQFMKNATVAALYGSRTTIYVPWERRASEEVAGAVANLTSQYGTGNVSYAKKDYLVANLSGSRPQYVTFAAGDTFYVGNYTDRAQAAADFQGAVFPDSEISVLAAGFDANSSGLAGFNSSYTYSYSIRIDAPEGPFFTLLQSKRAYAENDTVQVVVSAYAIKGGISSIVSAQEAG